ncbi:hypothetical protein A3B85_02515 [Candidatus Nomurabacteria bacterium RIFCSPHIGHO2_02_FULL_37_13]|uniref:DUF4190 domain-containing protein n=1 Tax=Candidatus Nomurabacteria bacterium RIFCSPHIGHO2_02_FULL_37_13 TaxID=1801750 RepID=A0A1F6W4P1_9BACT|nr:MAG: hypothetical protein A2640_00355 [Candidatus Nomurabacteria bacterium RIFCSPHIGHO2_01_FULL_36_23]OGI76772.1 MAG: hypothetical protein A3B85_02515 [Candidatus Nomurabacteria bacterium RIFCSPHIGHO2_02_FULL_37_13]OGI88501.1 MAG: hypothetical protein A2906_00115 [Candidatus Nomurabacteria bacterium RIFCSPLOWO2_01_FULL_37_25]
MKKNLLKISLSLFLLISLLIPFNTSLAAQSPGCPPDYIIDSTGVCVPSNTTQVCTGTGIDGLICNFQQILNSIIPVLVALGVVYLVWGIVRYVIGDSEEAKKKGKDRIIYGIIGLTVIAGLYGLVNIVINTFNLGGTSAPTLAPLTGEGLNCSLQGSPKFQDLACYITNIINNSVIPLIFAIATAFFVWGVVQFVINSDEEAKKEKGKQFMFWGIIALAVMISVWGLVAILGSTFGLNTSILPQVEP